MDYTSNMIFFDRDYEVRALQRDYQKPGGSLFVLYGRRRVGKTALLRKFASTDTGMPCVYHMADRTVARTARSSLARSMADALGEPTLAGAEFSDWPQLFHAFDRFRSERKTVLILDEYPYLVEAEPAFSSILQKTWDQHWKNESVMLVLCGSALSMMHRETISSAGPLFGRRTGQLLLRPLRFGDTLPFYADTEPDQMVQFYGVAGGVPHYVELAAQYRTWQEALEGLAMRPDGPLFPEAKFLLQEEVTKPHLYADLLRVISSGANRISEIAGRLAMPANKITRYLSVLQDLSLIERQVPVTEKNPNISKRGIYETTDPFLRLWYGCLAPIQPLLEFRRFSDAWQAIEKQLMSHQAWCFERICREFVSAKADRWNLARVGKYWDRTCEIDVVGFDLRHRVRFVAECKWSRRPVGENVLAALKRKAQQLWPKEFSKMSFALFSRGGFSPGFTSPNSRTELIDLQTLVSGSP